MESLYSRRNLDFLLFEVHQVLRFAQHPFFDHHDQETINLTLDTASEIANQWMFPALVDSDRHPPQLEQGQVKVHPMTQNFYRAFADAGLLASTFEQSKGGLQLPRSVFAAVDFF